MADEKRRILLVEDDTDLRDIVTFWLNGEGYNVTGVANGWEAIKTARAEPFDAVVLDLLMPDVDGYQTCRYMRHDPALCNLPVIIFSAVFVDEEERRMGLEAGADEFVPKSTGFQSLLVAVKRAIETRSERTTPTAFDEMIAAEVRREIEAVDNPE
jgi:DNA-binding response OmpR family regulator